ncbi:RNA polymerase subunit sigma-24 [Paenibacillus faecis]|uniref:Sigma-70 family RNA polymerase sigma factor n=1 Tax=Paenibacillus faecis TaxID=862114 RepID=A0A5D0CUI4_9BACL|nr:MULTISPECIES: sigma-70 family RNA polymerase sigma factor [Paenibacillus]MCA1292087.1 sigma-70 family RNA polymerase sigma factor [Paenibacillus sp. alder61]TYA13656.1 sigma-70 family RNA polymerase sigma factor [Paenibacillus faecis]GIO83086.1 RNA polymerase subunit sigma-24 [Paenibacillus faecis]
MPERLEWLLGADFQNLSDPIQEDVYYGFYDLVYGTIYYLVKDHQAAEDIIQEAFIKVVTKKPEFESVSGMKAWLKTVARNTTINYFRKNKKFRNHVDVESVYMDIEPINLQVPSVEQTVETKMMEEAILAYLNGLKPEYRQLIELRWKQGLSYKEIGERMKLCENIVRQRLFRTREGIKKMLYREWGGGYQEGERQQSGVSR